MIIDETCTTEAEFDAASTVDPATDPAHYLSGEITVKEGGRLSNWGVINIEGTEGKPLDPSQQEQTIRDKQSADILVESGGLLDNYGCISLKGTLHILGMLNNYSRYNDIIHAYDPDKNRIDYHKGIQVTWKDDVTQEGVVPGVLYVGIDAEGNTVEGAVVNNYGDIVLVPGTIELYGTFNNTRHPDPDLDYEGHLYLCTVDEAIIPIVNPNNPLEVEKRVAVDPPKESVFNHDNGTVNDEGLIGNATVELIHNGVLGKLHPTEATADKEIEMAEAALKTAEEALTAANADLEDLLERYGNGETVSENEVIAVKVAIATAQNAVTAATARVSEAKLTKSESQLAAMEKQVRKLNEQMAEVSVVDISNYAATLEKEVYEYTGKEIRPAVKVSGLTAEDYTVKYANNTAIGTATVTIEGKADKKFKGTIKKTFQITKKANPLNVKGKTGAVKYKKLKKKAQTLKVSKVIKVVNKGQGGLSYAKASGHKKITVSKTGKVTVKKGLKKGTYKVKVNVTAAGNQYYKAVTKTVTFKVRVR